jgi:alpha-glucosidase
MPDTVPVALGISITMPGIPVIFAGDEFGLVGDDGEDSRTPMPWDDTEAAAPSIDLYATLIHLRRDHEVLNTGGIRWLHYSDDVLVYARESAEECILLVAARGDYDLSLDANAVAGPHTLLFGPGEAEFDPAHGLVLRGTGASFTAWLLPGISIPPFAPEGTILELEY